MHRLYERFVLSYYLQHHPNYLPKAAYIDWDVTAGERSPYLPRMKTDITLQSGEKRLIIDTKYYESGTMQYNPLHDSRSFISNNLYQIYAYVKNSDKEANGNVAGILLYAQTDETVAPDDDVIIGGNHISLRTLDLSRNWDAITAQLDKLCEWLEASA